MATVATGKTENLRDFQIAKDKLTKLCGVLNDLKRDLDINRELRYATVDVEADRKEQKLGADELYIPQHIIDTNIRREQAKYISYVTSARRVAVIRSMTNFGRDMSLCEMDFTTRVRHKGWQFTMFRFVDGIQQNGYGVMELVNDITYPGHLKLQDVAYDDFAFAGDTKDIQSTEMVVRRYYFTRTQLLAMADSQTWQFNKAQVLKVVDHSESDTGKDYKDKSLYQVEKVMFRVNGVVNVAWSCTTSCDEWLRAPKPLYLGAQTFDIVLRKWVKSFETQYPYFVAPYTISEDMTIRHCKGRAFLDQDCQEAVTSLLSSYVTAHRRASGLYFSREDADPTADDVTQSNTKFVQGALINAKVKQFQLTAPESSMLSAIQAMASMNMQENSQVNYAANNRVDSRKTATEIQAATTESQLLGTTQLVLFSTTYTEALTRFFTIVRSRILAGLITDVMDEVKSQYADECVLKSAGDTDVIERQEKIVRMQQAWPVVQNTGMAKVFLQKLIILLFPEDAAFYFQAMQGDDIKTSLIKALASVIQGLLQDPSQLSPQAQTHIPALQQLLQQAATVLTGKPQPLPQVGPPQQPVNVNQQPGQSPQQQPRQIQQPTQQTVTV